MQTTNMADTAIKASRKLSREFDVFISYSHKDKAFAQRLELALERYRMPKAVAGDRRNLNVFRYEADMTAGDDYHRLITDTLAVSQRLVVICSPDAAASGFVSDEIQRFIAAHGAAHIIPVIVRGKPNNEATDAAECAFPAKLCEDRMPLAADFLGCNQYNGPLHKGPYASAFFSVLASIADIDRRTLEQIDERMRTRRRMITTAITSVVMVALAGAAIYAQAQAKEARRQRDIAESQRTIAQAERDTAEATGRRIQLLYLRAMSQISLEKTLTNLAQPGEVHFTNGAWVTLMRAPALGAPRDSFTFAGALETGKGRLVAVGHMAVLEQDSSSFVRDAIEWLRGPRGTKRIVAASGHCEVETLAKDNLKAVTSLRAGGYEIVDAPGEIDDQALRGAGVLVLGGNGGTFTAREVAALQRFVERGGGVFVAGLGWSFQRYGTDRRYNSCYTPTSGITKDLATYPLNRVLAPYGAAWTERF
ncbi:MAG: toll/interleukin-1 receptor domain-containing protein [Gemmatimonadaceae bacterium]